VAKEQDATKQAQEVSLFPGLKRISEVLGEQQYQGTAYRIPEILNTDMIVEGYESRTGEQGEWFILKCKFTPDGEGFGVMCGSKVVMKQIKALETAGAFPVVACFKKIKKYYLLV
jgi:hypothetical protein